VPGAGGVTGTQEMQNLQSDLQVLPGAWKCGTGLMQRRYKRIPHPDVLPRPEEDWIRMDALLGLYIWNGTMFA
jgi:hypothetical protein